MAQLDCPACGEDDDLTGNRTDAGIRISCGGDEIVFRPCTMTQYSRGTQLSIVGWQNVPLCLRCDAGAVTRSTESGAAMYPRTPPTGDQRQ